MPKKRAVRCSAQVILLVGVVAILGCVSRLDRGVNLYNTGNYDLAAAQWNPLAQKGDPIAQFNLGLIWEQGLGSTPKNLNEASQWFQLSAQQGYVPAMVRLANIQKTVGYKEAAQSWYELAARWGDSNAQNALRAWGKPVPPADFLFQQQQAAQQASAATQQAYGQALLDLSSALGCAVGGGCTSQNISQIVTSGNNQALRPNLSTTSNKTFQPSLSTMTNGCSSDFSCGSGMVCVKKPLSSTGSCMKSVDEFGTRQYELPDLNSVGPNLNLNGQCTFGTDCPIGFRCDSFYKACVKR